MEIINYETAEINERLARVDTLESRVSGLTGLKFVNSTAEMTDTTRIYVNAADGNWYEYSGGSWVSRGQYGGVQVDAELETEGAAADAKVTGDLKNATAKIEKLAGGFFETITNIIFESGFYRSENGVMTKRASSGWRSTVIPVSGKAYKISTHMYGGSTYAIYLADESDNVLQQYLRPGVDSPVFAEDYIVGIPENCTKIYLNDRVAEDGNSAKVQVIEYDVNKLIGEGISGVDYDVESIKDITGIEGIIEYGTTSDVSITLEENAMTGVIGETISERATANYKHCVIEKETPFYKVSTYTVGSAYYPYYILGVDKNDIIVYQNADNTRGKQREFYIYLPETAVKFYVTGSTKGTIQVWKVDPMTIAEKLKSLDNDIASLETSINTLQQTEIEALKTVAGYNRTNRLFNFGFITDTHSNEKTATENILRLKRIGKTNILDGILHGGDFISTRIDGTPFSLSEYFSAELEAINDFTAIDRLMFVKGNHDSGHNRDIVNDASSQQYSLLFANSLAGVVKNQAEWWKSYGYIDYPNMKIRLIVLESFTNTGAEGTSEAQDDWLQHTALKVPADDWVTVVIMHYLANDGYYTSTIQVLQDFAATNKLAAVICGHRHVDLYTNELGFNLINVTAGFIGFDVFTVDTANSVLYETRIGDGDSRAYHFGIEGGDNYQIASE